jgi:hypothetical protein
MRGSKLMDSKLPRLCLAEENKVWELLGSFTAKGRCFCRGSKGHRDRFRREKETGTLTRHPRCFCLWIMDPSPVALVFPMNPRSQGRDLSSRRGAPRWRAWPSKPSPQIATLPKSSEEIERCVIASFQDTDSRSSRGEFRQPEELLRVGGLWLWRYSRSAR